MTGPESTFDTHEHAIASILVDLALAEDLAHLGDLTCAALIDPDQQGSVQVVARKAGVLAGSPIGRLVFQKIEPEIRWVSHKQDGDFLQPGDVIAEVTGPVTHLLTGERTMLNFMTHLSGIATLTQTYVAEVEGTQAKILDTRKTHPGYRVLEKYAVRCGGGTNHRMGLYDGVLIKDNHLAAWKDKGTIAAAIQTARRVSPAGISIEVEVDTLVQLRDALSGEPDIVLLDNMSLPQLREAVAIRNTLAPQVLLEASGGITLAVLKEVAQTGVERISVGALTHSAVALDLAFDWNTSVSRG